jgi:hypothetical protein
MAEYTTLEQVKIRLKQFHIDSESSEVVFDDLEDNPLIEQLISQAKADIVAKRMYPDSYTDEKIAEDLKRFESVIVNVVVYDHSQAGENFMASYSENGVSRTWRDREDLFVGVFPFAKVL